MPERDANQLAADVRKDAEFLLDAANQGGVVFSQLTCEQMSRRAFALVGLVGTLQQERDAWCKTAHTSTETAKAQRLRAEALQQRVDATVNNEVYAQSAVELHSRAVAAEAALAEARQALAEIERMAGAAGPGETPAAPLASIARRALAATERAT